MPKGEQQQQYKSANGVECLTYFRHAYRKCFCSVAAQNTLIMFLLLFLTLCFGTVKGLSNYLYGAHLFNYMFCLSATKIKFECVLLDFVLVLFPLKPMTKRIQKVDLAFRYLQLKYRVMWTCMTSSC